jgi:hypothetical protein
MRRQKADGRRQKAEGQAADANSLALLAHASEILELDSGHQEMTLSIDSVTIQRRVGMSPQMHIRRSS